jgi:gamma-glutamyl hydrolase
MSVNEDWNGLEFISSIEHRRYPFYGVQFHPEKNLYEWVRNKNISHTRNAIKAAQYFADFFVDESRKSDNRFKDSKTEDQFVIYNYAAEFTGAKGSAFEQSYMFPVNVNYFDTPEKESSQANGIFCSLLSMLLTLTVLKIAS